jgi:glycosyltransferase involved in cell wall biosynthesis|tara:strand:+ start:14988 stop:16133 length:1146 start_codon:yes stop_codon:yes gene_type:complete
MGKKKSSNTQPLVSVCTPTFNRRPFIKTMFECFRNQNYPKNRIEWIIVDDGTDKIKDLIEEADIPQIRYFELEEKMLLGKKRNYMHDKCKGSIIVYMDDDDYYPPDRITHAVEKLQNNKKALCAGSSEIYVYFKTMKKMMQCGPYGESHATAGTFAFKKELLNQTRYNDTAALAEEKAFLKDYTIPFVQLDPLKTILVFSHDHNTYDKRKMFETSHPDFFKESTKTVESFIKYDDEKPIKKFFMKDIDNLLDNYKPGLPNMKPDVLNQMKELEKEREEMKKKLQQDKSNSTIMMNKPGEPPKQLSNQEVVQLIQQQQQTIQQMTTDRENIQNNMISMQNQIIQLSMQLKQLEEDNKKLKLELENKNGGETIIIDINENNKN